MSIYIILYSETIQHNLVRHRLLVSVLCYITAFCVPASEPSSSAPLAPAQPAACAEHRVLCTFSEGQQASCPAEETKGRGSESVRGDGCEENLNSRILAELQAKDCRTGPLIGF